jgi:protein-tyrosine kinase
MSISPKSSLVERLVQDRLRSGNLEASAAQLLQLGDAAPLGVPGDAAGDHQADPSGHDAVGSAAVNGDAHPNGMAIPAIDAMSVKPEGTASHGASGLDPMGQQGAIARPPMTRSLVTEPPLDTRPLDTSPGDRFAGDPFGDDAFSGAAAPLALELRPIVEPAPPPPPATAFPRPGLAPSTLVPPPATALPVSSSQPILAPAEPTPPPAQTQTPYQAPLAAPAIVAQTGSPQENERPDLVQGPPTIDAVALERGGMVDWSRTRSRISEEFRLVQRQILRAAFGPGAEPGFSNLLMVTSARPGEGKSFTSVNLAGSIARQGDHHVLLVDADSKRDSFCYALGLAEMRGLLDLVANPKLDPSPLIVKTPIDRLSILPVGRERERSAELFSTKEMTRLIQSLGRRYADRLLVLDAPPCLSTSDPAVLAPVVGQILFVVEADRTQRDEVEASLDLIQACPNITLVLNKQQISSRYTFGAYSSYYSS